jgi:hypothetical protein
MTKILTTLLTLVLCLTIAAMAADVNGKWTASIQGKNGTREQTYTLKADGGKLTGTVTGRQGAETPISDGKIDGDNISFTVKMEFNGNSVEQKYTGTISGDELKLKVEGGRGPARDVTAKRAK